MMVAALITPPLAPGFAVFAATFLLLGILAGVIDVLENSQAAELEREAGRPMINGFHGFWSLGFVAGGVVAAAAAAAGLGPLPHFVIVAVVVGVASVPLLAGVPNTRGGAATLLPSGTTRLRIGTAVGAVSAMAFFGILVESAGGDWGPIYLRDYGKTTLAVAAAVAVTFSIAMTVVRFTADRLTARTSAPVVAALGGVVTLVGAGCAVMVPLAFSAGANLGRTGTALIVVTAAGYAGSIVGPWLIGSTADRFGLRLALLIPIAAAAAVLFTAFGLRSRSVEVGGAAERS
ncbi:MAG: MFS transporter [Chloroflexi bacterium]|nr:MAG: MFS transporter [Chloroflexota bacterium]